MILPPPFQFYTFNRFSFTIRRVTNSNGERGHPTCVPDL